MRKQEGFPDETTKSKGERIPQYITESEQEQDMVQKQEKGNLDGARNAVEKRAKCVCVQVYVHARVCRL